MINSSVTDKDSGVNSIKRDIKRINVWEDIFIQSLNWSTWSNYNTIEDVPNELLPELVRITKSLIIHVIALNTIVKQVWEENIDSNFNFSSKTCSDFVKQIASTNEISSDIVIRYVKDKKSYIDSLLVVKE